MSEPCRYESQVITAAEEDRWTSSLREHVASCEECSAATGIASWMNDFSRIEHREHILPDPSIVWLKARLLRANAAAERVARPMTAASMTGYAVVAACWAALLSWKWTAIETWLNGFSPAHIIRGEVGTSSLSLSFFAIVFLLSSATVVLALHTILAEE